MHAKHLREPHGLPLLIELGTRAAAESTSSPEEIIAPNYLSSTRILGCLFLRGCRGTNTRDEK
jgi:hypothetical protein